MILCLWSPLHPLSKLLAIQDHTQNLEEQLWVGGRREVSIIFYRPVTRSDLKQERSFFRGSVSSFLQLVVTSNTYSFNGCLLVTCFIITKLIIYSFYHHNNENLGGSAPLHLLHRYWSEIRFGVRIQRAGQHTPHHDVPGMPNRICQSSDRPHFVNKKSQRNTPLPLPNRYWQEP